MRYIQRSCLAFVYLAISLSASLSFHSCTPGQPEPSTGLIPLEALFGDPEMKSPQLSPDGTKIAYLAPVDGVMNIFTGRIDRDDFEALTHDSDRGISRYSWALDGKHLLFLRDSDGDEKYHLFSVNSETAEERDLTPFHNVTVTFITQVRGYPDEVILAMNKDDPSLHDLYRLSLSTGELEIALKNPGDFVGWVLDRSAKIRCAYALTDDGGAEVYVRDSEDADWRLAFTLGAEDALTTEVLGFASDGKRLYVKDCRNSNTLHLMLVNLEDMSQETIVEDNDYDLGGVMFSRSDHIPQLAWFEKDRRELMILDESVQEDIDSLTALHDGSIRVQSRDNSDSLWLVSYEFDRSPIAYYVYDRRSRQSRFLGHDRPFLKDFELAEMEPFSITSRDGLTIRGYVTYPVGLERRNLPMVVRVHGGPYLRDTWGFEPEPQWFANRGYACMQVNYRGSTGYGKDFVNAANHEWGGKMHDDIIDAVDWAIRKRIADPNRIAIYGSSWGGFAALVGAAFTPDVFCCAVDVVGPANLYTWIKTIPVYWASARSVWYYRIGNPETEEELLKSRSPLYKADQIKIPMLIVQGANDPRVPISEYAQIIDALKKNSVDYEHVLFENEGHGFQRSENRLKYYHKADRFLSRYLGGRFESGLNP